MPRRRKSARHFWFYIRCRLSLDDVRQVEDRHIQRHENEENDRANYNRENRLHHTCEFLHLIFDVAPIEVSDFIEHRVEVARLFTRGDHSRYHGWKLAACSEGIGKRRTFLDKVNRLHNRVSNDYVTGSVRRNLQRLENRHTALRCAGKCRSKPSQRNLSNQFSEQWKLQFKPVVFHPATRSLHPLTEREKRAEADKQHNPCAMQ